MGANLSLSRLADNELLRKFCGLEQLTENDPFWNQLLSFTMKPPLIRNQARELEETVDDLCEALSHNTATTGNFAAFVRVFLRRAAELKSSAQCDDRIFLWQTSNALVLLWYCCKFFAQHRTQDEFNGLFHKAVLRGDGVVEVDASCGSLSEELLNALVEIIVDLPLNEMTQETHIEALHCILVLLSPQLFLTAPSKDSMWLRYLFFGKCSIHACLLTKVLLTNYCDALNKSAEFSGGGSIVFGLAASLWNAVQWGSSSQQNVNERSIGTLSLLLLFVLVSQSSNSTTHNPYRQALFSFSNSQEKAALTSPSKAVATFKLDYSKLYASICSNTSEDCSLLLLYLVLHQNQGVKNYILSRVNMEELVVPVLKILHSSQSSAGTYNLYLSLIVLLILSEDDFFCKVVHETTIKNVDWYSDRAFNDMTLGGLIILVLIKRIHLNIVKVRDRYMHTNCFAALSNMSTHFKNLHPYVAQKLTTLCEAMQKRHARLVDHIRVSAEYDLSGGQEQQQLENLQDIAVLEEGIRMLLETINSCLQNNLRHNPNLVYTLLYKRELFDSFQNHPTFQDLIQNIDTVLGYFTAKVNALEKSASPAEVLDVIQRGALQWPTDRLKKFPVMKFKYVEDPNTDEFFVPYVWTLIFLRSGIYWDATKVKLFNASALLASTTLSQQE